MASTRQVLTALALLLSICLFASSGYAETYECTNKHGDLVLSDRPCNNDTYQIKDMDIRDIQLKDVEKEVTATAKSWIGKIIEEIYTLLYQLEAKLNSPSTESPVAIEVLEAIAYECKGKKTCGEMFSCEEARYYFDNCPNSEMTDEDADGIPCENLWCQ